jgi:hypothetical protein
MPTGGPDKNERELFGAVLRFFRQNLEDGLAFTSHFMIRLCFPMTRGTKMCGPRSTAGSCNDPTQLQCENVLLGSGLQTLVM